jgi:hypothetical protein
VAPGASCASSWSSETLSYIVIEAGTWTLKDGTSISAGLSNISSVRSKSGDQNASQTVYYGGVFTANPIVLHTVNSYNDSDFVSSSVWEPGFGVLCNSDFDDPSSPPGLFSMCLALETMETATTHAAETIGWIAIDPGNATVDSYSFVTGSGTLTGHGNCTTLSGFSFSSAPLLIGSKLTAGGVDGSLTRYCGSGITNNSFSAHVDEDQVNDAERYATSEVFGYFAFPEAALVKIAEPTLIAYYSFDGIGGQTIYDTSGNVLNGTRGASSASGSDDPTNVCNGYLYFDGTSDYVRIPDNALFDIADEYSISVWFNTDWNPYTTAGDQLQTIVGKDTNFEINLIDNGFFYYTWRFQWNWQNSSGTNREFETNSLYLEYDRWYHAVFTFTNGAQRVYLDGTLIADTANYADTPVTNAQPVQIGADSSPLGKYFSGTIDEVRIYQGVLDALEISELAQSYDNCAPTRKLAYFDFDYTVLHGVANEVTDATGNNAGLTAYAGATTAELDRAVPATPGTCEYLNLDGVNDYLQSSDSATELQVFNDYSVSFWTKSASVQKNYAAIYAKTNVSGTVNHWTLQQEQLTGNIVVAHGDNFWDTQLDLTDLAGIWRHVVIVRENSTQRVYLDGSLYHSGTFSSAPGNGDGHLNIGTDRTGSSSQAWQGYIDELNVYDYALTASAVSSLYSETHQCKQAFSSCPFYVRDEFQVASYSQNNGTEFFSGNWSEDDDGLANSGDLLINNGEVVYQASSGTVNFDRGINLSQSDNPKLTFRLRSTNTDAGGFFADNVEVYAFDGSNYQLLERIDSLSGTDATTRTYNLGGYAIENGGIRFNFDTNNADEIFYLDNVDVRPFCSPTQFLDIITDGAASTCADEEITVRVCQQSDCTSLATNFTGTVTLSTSSNHGTWSKASANGTLIDTVADDGQATYTFVSSDMGSVTLNLANTHADVLKVTALGSSLTTDISDNISFSDNVITVTPTYDSGQTAAIAGKPLPLQFQFVARDGAICSVVPCTGTFTLDSSATHNTSIGPATPSTPSLAGILLPASGTESVTLTFNEGTANSSLLLNDVGHFSVNVTDNTSGCRVDDNNIPLSISGNSNSIVVRPFGLRLANEPSNPQIAQDSFSMDVEAVLWSAVDDIDSNGVPDTGVDLSDNTLLPRFGNETQLQTPTISLVETWPTSAGATEGTLTTGLTSSGGGRYQMSLSYSEVGEIQLQADIQDYLGSSDDLNVQTPTQWRRFRPDYLQFSVTNASTLAPTCAAGSYSYFGQPMDYNTAPVIEVRAYGASNQQVDNYKENYFNWAPSNILTPTTDYVVTDSGFTSGTPSLIFPAQPWSVITNSTSTYGSASLYALNHAFLYAKSITPLPAFFPTPEIVFQANYLVDSDNACFQDDNTDTLCNPLLLSVGSASNQLTFGRLSVSNASGPASSNVTIDVEAQYWDAISGSFVRHTADQCTQINSSAFGLDNYTGSLVDGNVQFETATKTLSAGTTAFTLNKLETANSGSVETTLNLNTLNLQYLQYNWEGAGVDTNPKGRSTFGVYRGHDHVIFWEELD